MIEKLYFIGIFQHFWISAGFLGVIHKKWTKLKYFFGLCLGMSNHIRKTLVQVILTIVPKKVLFTPP